MTDIRARYLASLIQWARIPGAKAYAWARAKELSESPIFAGIDKELVEKIRGLNEIRKS